MSHEVHEHDVDCGTSAAARVRMPNTTLIDITENLETVHGGAAGRAIASAAKAGWNAVKPWLGRADSAVDTFSKYAGGALAAKEGYDMISGGNAGSTRPTEAPAQPPAQP